MRKSRLLQYAGFFIFGRVYQTPRIDLYLFRSFQPPFLINS
nr:MAG TPA: hypothetical protein [Caudoviricetes sp.]